MTHEIDMSNGRANMAYVGTQPWHGLGHELQSGAPIETWITSAGMDFTIERANVAYNLPDGTQRETDARTVLYRSDNGNSLGVVSPRYKPVQPTEVLEFFRDLVAHQDMELETAGCLKGGAVYWALAKTGDAFTVHGSDKDRVEGYVLLSTASNGSMATRAKFTSVRVVCQNTLSMANNRGEEIRISHASTFIPESVKSSLGLSHEVFDRFSTNVNILADTGVSKKQSFNLLADLYYPDRDKAKDESAKMMHVYRTLELVENSQGADYASAKGTAWGLLNGVTRYIDHEKKAKTVDSRMHNAWFGTGESIKNQMWDKLLKDIVKQSEAEKVSVAA